MEIEEIKQVQLTGDNDGIGCPYCEGSNLKQTGLQIYGRAMNKRDAPIMVMEFTFDGHVTNRILKAESVRFRGNATVLSFECEECPGESFLWFVGHKGETMVYWGARNWETQ